MMQQTQSRKWNRLLMAAVLLGAVLLLGGVSPGVRQVQAASKYSAYFRENGGSKTTAMGKLRQTVEKGKALTLPKLPAKSGYTSLGWATTKNATTAQYKAGQSIVLKKNTVFYAVRRKYYIVRFNNNKGTSTSTAYSRLRTRVYENRFCLLPDIPEIEGYNNLGWTTTKGGTSPLYQPGKKVRITAATTFYAVREKASMCTVVFADAKGSINMEYSALAKTVKAGEEIVMPSVKNSSGYTFTGWSHNPSSSSVSYLAGQKVPVNVGMRLYAVMRQNSLEEDITEATLATGWQQSYRKIIFVGDSRVNRMANTLKNEFNSSVKLSNVSFISKEGDGLAWLKTEGKKQLMEVLSTYYSKTPTAVIFNLGINDLGNLSGYETYLQELAPSLLAKNCKLFYMSLNPINSHMIKGSGHAARTEEQVLTFNEGIRSVLCKAGGSFTYIDAFTYLIVNGYSHDSGMGDGNATVITLDDGLHFSKRPYKRIYNYCIDCIMRALK